MEACGQKIAEWPRVCIESQRACQRRANGKQGWERLVRVDYHGSKEVPIGTWQAILKAAGIKYP